MHVSAFIIPYSGYYSPGVYFVNFQRNWFHEYNFRESAGLSSIQSHPTCLPRPLLTSMPTEMRACNEDGSRLPMERFTINLCIRGYHVYKDIWNPLIGETLNCQAEFGNVHDPYAVVALTKYY